MILARSLLFTILIVTNFNWFPISKKSFILMSHTTNTEAKCLEQWYFLTSYSLLADFILTCRFADFQLHTCINFIVIDYLIQKHHNSLAFFFALLFIEIVFDMVVWNNLFPCFAWLELIMKISHNHWRHRYLNVTIILQILIIQVLWND